MEDNEEDDEDDDEDDVEDNEDAEDGNAEMILEATVTKSLVVSGIVSVVESTSGTTMSCNAEGDTFSSGHLRRLLQDPEVDGKLTSQPISVVLSHSVMHFDLSGSTD